MTNAVCSDPDLEMIDVSLGDGKDELKVEGDYAVQRCQDQGIRWTPRRPPAGIGRPGRPPRRQRTRRPPRPGRERPPRRGRGLRRLQRRPRRRLDQGLRGLEYAPFDPARSWWYLRLGAHGWAQLRTPRRLLPLAMLAALAGGAATAVLASGSGSGNRITIGDNPGEKITIYGSGLDDDGHLRRLHGGRHVNANRTHYEPSPRLRGERGVPGERILLAGSGRLLEARRAPGERRAITSSSMTASTPPGFRILLGGGKGGDSVTGTEGGDEISGGRGGDDSSAASRATMSSTAAAASTAATAAPGRNDIRRCEGLR